MENRKFDQDGKKLDPWHIAGGNVRWCSHCEKQDAGSLER